MTNPTNNQQRNLARGRVVSRAMGRIVYTAEAEQAYECYRHYDGGEFSGPAHDRLRCEREDAVLFELAQFFGTTAEAVTADWMAYEHSYEESMQERGLGVWA